ncbi:type I polyketide synthase [Nucisporomicrobium flavum]|uniref:type I polyketide synthase n=1 Tax=Nucisporomicrobium flavum TaxID=2785915 RepID=UPI0018F49ECE|nr:type I polyketide synthase [Nucisporomicrobium flavum]
MTVAEPIAIVGMACRLPGGVHTPEELWELLRSGQDTVGEMPADRWDAYVRARPENAAALRNTTRRGAFLTEPGAFDADFFGITPREAELMDPQQRLILTCTWEALEDAGIPPDSLAGSDTGVFMGVGSDDYGRQLLSDLPRIEAWTGVAAAPCVVANRVSYQLDLHGPSFSVDAACASSLVALHASCASLRSGECSVALLGAINVMVGPALFMVLDAAGAISPDGRSKPFEAAADGYGRGEGGGVLVLKLLSRAVEDGDRVLAVIRGSAVNQDGRTNGIMAPNGAAQEAVVRAALRQAGVDPASVGYVEAHGTGTRAGDPIEAAALGAVYGSGREPGNPCLIGSVKSNIGHLEAGAGLAGVLKVVLALRHGEIPLQAGFDALNPDIEWDRVGLRVVTQRLAWPESGQPRRAGVSCFGYGGTVGHVVLEEAPAAAANGQAARRVRPAYPLSAASPAALRAGAERLADAVPRDANETFLAGLASTLWSRRTHLPHRAVVIAEDAMALRYELRKLAASQPTPRVTIGHAPRRAPADAVWVFSGHGSQWAGMGRELLLHEPAFAEVVDAVDHVYRAEMGFSPREVIMGDRLDTVDRIQAMIFVIQVGLAAVWRELGLRPCAVIGHSVGEIAAAVVGGILTLEEAAMLSCRRSNLLRRVAGGGAMAMVQLSWREATEMLADETDVVPAVQSSLSSTVVAGKPEAVAAFRRRCADLDIVSRAVDTDVAFHSPQMEPLLDDLRTALATLRPTAPRIPVYSTALDDARSTAARDDSYWPVNLRSPVLFADAVTAAAEDGHRTFLEVSPHPVVTHSIAETLSALDIEETFAGGSLRRGQPELLTLATALGALHCHGVRIDGDRLAAGPLLDLPPVPWQHRTYWREPARVAGDAAVHDIHSGNLLGARLELADSENGLTWRTLLDLDSRPYPGNHIVRGAEIVPAAVLLNTFFAAVGRRALTDVRFLVAVRLTEPQSVQVTVRDGRVRMFVKPAAGEAAEQRWLTSSTAAAGPEESTAQIDPRLASVADRCPEEQPVDRVGAYLSAVGIEGAGLPWDVTNLHTGDGELVADVRIEIEPGTGPDLAWARIVDAVGSIAPLVFGGDPVLRLLVGVDRIELPGEPESVSRVSIRAIGPNAVDVLVSGAGGQPAGALTGVTFAELDGDTVAVRPDRLVHRIEWHPLAERAAPAVPGAVVVVGGDPAIVRLIEQHCREARRPYRMIAGPDADPDAFAGLTDADVVVVPAGQPGPAVDEQVENDAWRLARTAQLIAGQGQLRPPRLWSITAGVRTGAAAPAQAALWGLCRIIAGEHPEMWGAAVDLEPADLSAGVRHLVGLLGSAPEADVVALRDGTLTEARLARVDVPPVRPPLWCRPDASYLITGGLGTLGLHVAEWLATRGARRIILTSRTAVPPRSTWDDLADASIGERVAAIRRLESMGVTVRTLAVDCTNAAAMRSALDADALGMPAIRGVFHLAGVLDNSLVRTLDRDGLRRVLRPKVAGAQVLDELFPVGTLDHFVLFSSFGQFLRLPGQAGYATANAFLDGLAHRRRAAGGTDVMSLCWTSWKGLGMAVDEVVDAGLREHGVGALDPGDALLAWEYASRFDEAQLSVLPVVTAEGIARLPILAGISAEADRGEGMAAADEFAGLTGEALRERLRSEIALEVGAEMGQAAEDIDVRQPLNELGLDSVLTLAIRRRLEKRYQVSLPAALIWNRPTVEGIGEYLAGALDTGPAVVAKTSDDPEVPDAA